MVCTWVNSSSERVAFREMAQGSLGSQRKSRILRFHGHCDRRDMGFGPVLMTSTMGHFTIETFESWMLFALACTRTRLI